MYDVLVLKPGGGWATDQTGALGYCRARVHRLAQSNRGRRQIVRLIDRRAGKDLD